MNPCTKAFLAGVFAIVVWMALGCRQFSEAPREEALQKASVDAILRGGLVPDQYGVVPLPEGLKKASADGAAYVTRTQGGVTLVLFPTWIGKAGNVRGYLYASDVVGAALTKDEAGRDALDLSGPVVFGVGGRPPLTLRKTAILKKLTNDWYYVGRDLD